MTANFLLQQLLINCHELPPEYEIISVTAVFVQHNFAHFPCIEQQSSAIVQHVEMLGLKSGDYMCICVINSTVAITQITAMGFCSYSVICPGEPTCRASLLTSWSEVTAIYVCSDYFFESSWFGPLVKSHSRRKKSANIGHINQQMNESHKHLSSKHNFKWFFTCLDFY